jgi:hypothetical protein
MVILKTDIGSPIEGTGSPAFINRWVAAHNPVILEFQRLDFQFIGTTSQDSGNETRLDLPVSNPNYIYEVGDVIPVFETAPDYAFINFYTITDINTTTGSPTIDATFGTLTTGSFNSHRRQNYYIEIGLEGTLPSTNETIRRSIKVTTNRKGEVRADVSGLLRSFLALDLSIQFDIAPVNSFINQRDVKDYISTGYDYKEFYKDFTGSALFGNNPINAVNGAFQSRHEYNGYYDDYLVTVEGNLAKPLTRFARPVYWLGLPYTIDYLLDMTVENLNIEMFRHIYKDEPSNEDPIGTLIAADSEFFSLFTEIGVTYRGVNRVYYNFQQNITDAADFMVVFLMNVIDLPPSRAVITQDTYIDIKRPSCNGYHLRWRNTLGGTDYYFFDNFKNESTVVEGGGIYSRYFDSIELQTTTGEWASKKSADQLQMQAVVSRENMEGFKDLLTSPAVQLYVDGGWETILIVPQSYRTYEQDDVMKIELLGTRLEKQIQTA